MLQGADKLNEIITKMLISSPIDHIVVPPDTDINEMAWKFNHKSEPTVIMECSKFELLQIVATLAKTVSDLQAEKHDKHNTISFTGVSDGKPAI